MTLEDLATPTSGLPHIPSLGIRYAWRNRHNPYASFKEAPLESALTKTRLRRKGTYNYATLGFGLLGFAVSQAYQTDYTNWAKGAVLVPLGMKNLSVQYHQDLRTTPIARLLFAVSKLGVCVSPNHVARQFDVQLHDILAQKSSVPHLKEPRLKAGALGRGTEFFWGTIQLSKREEKQMSPKKVTFSIIIVSLLFAVAIIVSSYLFADTGYAQTATFILIALWFVPFAYLTTATRRKTD